MQISLLSEMRSGLTLSTYAASVNLIRLISQVAAAVTVIISAGAGFASAKIVHDQRQGNGQAVEISADIKFLISETLAAPSFNNEEIQALVKQAKEFENKYNYGEAAQTWEKLVTISTKALGPDHPDTASSLNNLASLYIRRGIYSKAEPLFIRALAIREKALGHDHLETAISLHNLAFLYAQQGHYSKAEPLYIRTLAISEKALGPDHPDTNTILNNLAFLHQRQGYSSKAEPLYVQALAIKEKALGPDHPDTALSLNNLALLYKSQGHYSKAEPVFIRALAINEKALGPDHPDTATALNNLASLYQRQGYYSKAEPLYARALAISEKALGPDHPDTAISLNNLALLYQRQGYYSKAEPLYIRALATNEKALGPDHPDTAQSLSILASLYADQGHYSKAEPLYARALAIREKALGPDHSDTAITLNNLALLYWNQGMYVKAQPLHIRALAISEKALGPDHPDTAISLNNLALLYKSQGHYSKAEPLYARALAIREKALGPDHPDTASSLNNLAMLYKLYKQVDKVLPLLSRGISIQNRWLMKEAPLQSIATRATFFNSLDGAWIVPFDLASKYPPAAELALRTRLNRQGILQDIEQRQSLLLQSQGPQQVLASQLVALNTQLSSFSIKENLRQELRRERDQLEGQLYRLMPDLNLQEVSPAQVAAVLPSDSVMVEFQRYKPYNGNKPKTQRWGEARYLALILKPNSSIKAVPLGPAKPIEAAIAKALVTTQEALADSQTNWDSVRHLVLDPLKSQLKDSNHWFLSPDAELTRIPFLALPSANSGQRLLSDDVKISVLTTGRDLLRLQKPPGTSEKAAVIVNPSFSLNADSGSFASADLSEQVGQRRSAELGSKVWAPLPQTQSEGEEIAQLLSVPLISKDKATTNFLQTIDGPKVLHIATHGFFQPNQETTPPDLLRTISSDHQLLRSLKSEDPMLRSGLVLAGADNPTANPADDGYLTSAEATGLQLDGTEIVVLSACSTGQGDSKTGEGLYGLQRALTVAGARSTLLSLWKVDDDATRAFMVRYYTLLKEGKGRGEALVQVQREFRTDPAYKAKGWDRPYYWAAWQLTGDWKPIKGL